MESYSSLSSNNVNEQLDNQFNNYLSQMAQPTQTENHGQQTSINQLHNQQQVKHYNSSPVLQQPSVIPHKQVHNPVQTPVQQPVQNVAVQEQPKLKIPGEQLLLGVISNSTKKILFFIVLSLSLIAAHSWSEAMKGLVRKYITLSNDSELDNVIYAAVISLLVVIFIQILKFVGVDVGEIPIAGVIQ